MEPVTQKLIHFLLVFDHDQSKLIEEETFEDGAIAVQAYGEMERKYGGRDRIEVVLIGSDSRETVRHTHANYFDETVTSPYLLGLG